jgi:hypothetical protein
MIRLVKDVYGATISALITFALFLGPLLVGILYALFPADMVESLVVEDRPPVYFDGAFVLDTKEVEGELDGTAEVEPPPEEAPPEEEGTGGSPDGSAKPEEATTTEKEGAETVGEPDQLTNARGVSAGAAVGKGTAAKGTGTPGRKQKRSRRRCPKTYDGIVRRPDGVFQIERSIVKYYTSSLKRFNTLGWSKNNKDGKGWIISGFNCQGPMWHGGMRRGDIVLSVNGKKTNNMLQILRLYPKLRNQRRFEVDVIRKDRKLTLRYEIVDG